jgi:hypothetical protein
LREIDIRINDKIIEALLRSGRLQWHQKADELAMRKALSKLLADLAEGRAW